MASRVQSWRWLFILSGILGVAAGILTFAWPDITLYVVSILVAWYLIAFGIIHMIDALGAPKVGWWWTGLLLGIAELILGVWAARSLGAIAADPGAGLVGVWAILYGVNEITTALCYAKPARELRAAGRLITTASRSQLPCPAGGREAARFKAKESGARGGAPSC